MSKRQQLTLAELQAMADPSPMPRCVCWDEPPGTWHAAFVRPFTADEDAMHLVKAHNRVEWALAHGAKDHLGRDEPDKHLRGVKGEHGYCLLMGEVWLASNGTYDTVPDVLPDIEIQNYLYRGGCLKGKWEAVTEQRRADRWPPRAQRRYVALTDALPERVRKDYLPDGASLELLGWLYGYEMNHRQFVDDPGKHGYAAFFVERQFMHRFPFHTPKTS